ncbi:hypothetical protein C8Q75DRAFT_789221 [Abortiporus biennis]|nr:hypothetical protein C8Q75DRAFT_789221 [Abortiporus biennis]
MLSPCPYFPMVNGRPVCAPLNNVPTPARCLVFPPALPLLRLCYRHTSAAVRYLLNTSAFNIYEIHSSSSLLIPWRTTCNSNTACACEARILANCHRGYSTHFDIVEHNFLDYSRGFILMSRSILRGYYRSHTRGP